MSSESLQGAVGENEQALFEQTIDCFSEKLAQNGLAAVINKATRLGRADSGHEVMFVDVINIDDIDADQGEQQRIERVAIKPFVGDRGRATQRAQSEMRNYTNAKRLGFNSFSAPKTPGVPNVVSYGDNSALLVTAYEEGLVPLNTVDWQVSRDSPEFEQRIDLVKRLGEFTADMHFKGVVHGDWKAKNILMDDTGELWIPDLEKGQVSKSGNSLETPARQKHAVRDVAMLLNSIMDHGFLPRAHNLKVYETLVQNLAIPYVERMAEQYCEEPSELGVPSHRKATTIPDELLDYLDSELSTERLHRYHGRANQVYSGVK